MSHIAFSQQQQNQNQNQNQLYNNGDVESQAVNVTPIPVAQQQQYPNQNNDLDTIMLDIIPGVYQVQSAYHNNDVNLYSQKVIRYAMALCCFNVLIAILSSAGGYAEDFINALISIIINALVLYLAVRCVRQQNAVCCCGLPALSFYRYFLMINIFMVVINLVVLVAILATGSLWAIIFLVYYGVIFMLYCTQLKYANKIQRALNVQVQPGIVRNNTFPVPVPVYSPGVPQQAVQTTAVVQASPSIAHVEIDTSNHESHKDPNGYGG